MSAGDAEPAELWNDDHVPPVSRHQAGKAVRALVGLALLALGGWYGWEYAAAWAHFHNAPRVAVVIDSVDYTKRAENATRITVDQLVAGQDVTDTVDDPITAPARLSPGEQEFVLVDTSRPGHVLFPSQLHWVAGALPALAIALGLAGLLSGVIGLLHPPGGRRGA
ncbi:hypothetical protein [Kitasatospora sp. NBC_01302]|uniref:hypothetical protein n=1 Tax=Kitasatospora sp. NBC_01302 TaxID=2903575 RepID=UPI002E0FE5C6|nr:hypothetical protein OG294_03910 [Kitasatospora sp. NBC_01302]